MMRLSKLYNRQNQSCRNRLRKILFHCHLEILVLIDIQMQNNLICGKNPLTYVLETLIYICTCVPRK